MTVRSELKAVLDPIFGARVYKDRAPAKVALPYAVIVDLNPTSAVTSGDSQVTAWRHDAQVDVWQAWNTEDETLVLRVMDAVDGADSTVGMAYGVTGSARVPEVDAALTRHTIFVSLKRLR